MIQKLVQQTRSCALENYYHIMSPFGIHPKPNNRAFHPPTVDIRNHIGNEVIHKVCTWRIKCSCTVLSGKKRKKPCGTCTGYLHGNCGVCKFCFDMPVFLWWSGSKKAEMDKATMHRYNLASQLKLIFSLTIVFGCTIQALTLLSTQVHNHSSKKRYAPYQYP